VSIRGSTAGFKPKTSVMNAMKRNLVLCISTVLSLTAFAADAARSRPGLLFREDWRETPPVTPVTQEHVSNPALVLTCHGPAAGKIRKSHHDQPADDPYYIWSGEADGNWAVSLRHREADMDLSGQGKIRWRAKQTGFRQLRVVLKLGSGKWVVSDQFDGDSLDWRVREFNLADLRWRALDMKTIVEGKWEPNPDLSRVEEIGCTDLMAGGRTPASSRVDWIEVYGTAVPKSAR
jgi:hypothetical protein